MESVRRYFDGLKFKGAWKVGFLDGRHILINLSRDEYYARIFSKQSILIEGIPMKLLKWTPDFDPNKELPIVPIWFKLPGIKLHFFNHKVLFNIGKALGRPLKLDGPTFNLSRPSVARILVERNITLPAVEEIWLGTEHNGYWQKIIAEQRPYYCHHCNMFGHTDEKCFRLHPALKMKTPKQLLEEIAPQNKEVPTANTCVVKMPEMPGTFAQELPKVLVQESVVPNP
ncbi:uncharacterized protein LOC110035921 [Phalaenopsis equestris]|uniref:uncharacterized protein LOC110035921 n=1 Tax=Phalaenopsis equestris TaxID=78828 RepID=UPI0009E31922|nr:uncharacterized protein LOC110035921 [Phalaenopsis equestris]